MNRLPIADRGFRAADIKTLSLSSLGGTLEYYDFVIYVFFAGVIGSLFFPAHMSDGARQMQAFGIFAAGYLARPFGGLVFGHFADRLGRKRMFSLSVLLMALPTLLIACLPTFEHIGWWAPALLLMMRVLQGVAVGGELTGAWVFVGEHAPRRHYGLALGTITAGLTGGILLGSLAAYVIHAHYGDAQVRDFAWRIPFVLGGVFGLVTVYLRRFLEETPIFRAMAARRELARGVPLMTVVREHRGTLLYLGLQTWVLSAAVGVVLLLGPTLLQKHYGVVATESLAANSLATFCVIVGCVLAGWASDHVGVRRVMFVGWLGLGIATWLLFSGLPNTHAWLLWHYAAAGFFTGSIAIVPIFGVRAFPAAVRATGLSFGYNAFYAVFGGLTPVLVTALMGWDRMAPAHYVTALCVLGAAAALVRPQSAHPTAPSAAPARA
ncbi:MFS transporter [Variovorax sp. KK3]|uniref:MFS transporter n=1 Tax=Variovorax sp. KK3 TaxID=1855728 RepID=UPI00097C602F|nr:MFS transporter [Variovorax sp. KK3]